MKNLILLLFIAPLQLLAQKDHSGLVNPFIGTGGHGHTYPGASYPFGMMQLSPDTRMADWDGSSGYHYSDSVIYGFSHTHLSGTGIPDYCDVLLMPFTGDVQWKGEGYRSSFSHRNEKASPGYYEVLLDKHQIKAQLTSATRSGMHQYSFPAGTHPRMLIDLVHRDEVLDAHLEKVDAYTLRGYRFSKSWAANQKLYFYLRFEQPIQEFVIENEKGNVTRKTGKSIRAYTGFKNMADGKLRCKIAISGVSMDGARKNLQAEIPDWSFNNLHHKAKQAWNKELSQVEVKGGSRDQQVAFYTALYHTMLVPNIYQDVDGQYRGTDGEVHRAEGFTNYSVFSLWDTYRAYHPLMTILNQKRTTDWIKTFLAQYQQGGMLPVWELSGNETFCMIGYHSVPVIVDAYQKGIRGFDAELALRAMRSYAESDRFGLDQYKKLGYMANDHEHESVSKTVEYAYDDWCIAQLARSLGNDSVYRYYLGRSANYQNVFDPQTKHMRGKIQGMWHHPFDAREINNFYTEGNSWHYSFAAQHDLENLIRLHGGDKAFEAKLGELFTTTSETTGRNQADVTGLIGQYAQGNEPSHHMAYLFNYTGSPWRTQELVSRICREMYTNAPDGLIGNEDCGQMSAWYVMSAMGFYPVTPGDGKYVIGTPLFDEVKIRLENGRIFTIKANRPSATATYVSATSLNNRNFTHSYIDHRDIIKGGLLHFSLSDTRSKTWGVSQKDRPHTSISTRSIAAPYFNMSSNKFRDQLKIEVGHIDPGAQFEVSNKKGWRKRLQRGDSIFIRETDTLALTAFVGDNKSASIEQAFFKLPSDRTIEVLSKVHPMYTAGGNDALVDGILGNSNWRSGLWQSYFDQDFEAIIDLKGEKQLSYLGVHVLQDVSPWIIYPSEVIFYSSEDGKDYKELFRVKNGESNELKGASVQQLGQEVKLRSRYIKVKAVNGGKLPSWHESAGNPSHLFIDEVIVR